MSILLKRDILQRAQDANTYLLGPDFDEENLQACSYDLRVGAVFKDEKILSLSQGQENNWDIPIKPSEIVTMLTLEEVNLPKNICGTVFPINSWSSTGFLILNPGHIDPGYRGPISICAINLSKETKYIKVKEKIFTILFHQLVRESDGYDNDEKYLALNRLEKERTFFRNKASKLSKSIFDLIKENEYEPLLKNLIESSIKQHFYKLITKLVGWIIILATIAGTIYVIMEYYKPSK
jgi:deoxycytidine triphosphate deaminase